MEREKMLQMFAEGEGQAEGAEMAEAAEGNQAAQTSGGELEERMQSLEQRLREALEGKPEPQEPDADLVRQHWQAVDRVYQALAEQADGLKQRYPGFDLRAEMKDPRFSRMLRAGVDMESAYQAIHAGEILPAAMQYAARTIQERMASVMRSGADRPTENGLRSGGAVMMGGQVSKMTRQDYANVCRMVERGERVSFG